MGTVKTIKPINDQEPRPSRQDAEKAVEILLRYIGEDAGRPGLRETPARVIRSFDEHFTGYAESAGAILDKTFADIEGYEDFVLVRAIEFVSHCEHHMAPVIGRAHVAYWPHEKVVGLSKLARLVDMYARRLTTQEMMTKHILDALNEHLKPRGAAVMIDAVHHCMASRGVHKPGSSTVTSLFSGRFQDNVEARERFLKYCQL